MTANNERVRHAGSPRNAVSAEVPEELLFERRRAFEIGMKFFPAPELGSVKAPRLVRIVLRIKECVKHLVENDETHEELRHTLAVKQGVDSNQIGPVVETSEDNVPAGPLRPAPAAPGDTRRYFATETPVVHLAGKSAQVVNPAARPEIRGATAGRAYPDTTHVPVNKFSQDAVCCNCGFLNVLCKRLKNIVRRVEEHVVQGNHGIRGILRMLDRDQCRRVVVQLEFHPEAGERLNSTMQRCRIGGQYGTWRRRAGIRLASHSGQLHKKSSPLPEARGELRFARK